MSRHCIVGKAGIGGWEEDTFGKLMKVRRGLMKDQCIALLRKLAVKIYSRVRV